MPVDKIPCHCSDCTQSYTYTDGNNVEHKGHLWEPRVVKAHRKRERQLDRQAIESRTRSIPAPADTSVLLATVAGVVRSPFEESMVVRPRDALTSSSGAGGSEVEGAQDGHTLQALDGESGVDWGKLQPAEPSLLEKVNPQEYLRKISALQSSVAVKEQRYRHPILKFSSLPLTTTEPPSPLDLTDGPTARFIQYRTKDLPTLYAQASALLPIGDYQVDRTREKLLEDIEKYMRQAVAVEIRAWRDEIIKLGIGVPVDGPHIVSTESVFMARNSLQPFIALALFTAVVMHTLASVSVHQSTFLLSAIKGILFGAFMWCNAPSRVLDSAQRLLLKCIPRDIRTALGILQLEPELVHYACCPSCFSIYAPDPDPSKEDDRYPHECTHVGADGTCCGATLVFEDRRAPKRKNEPSRTVYKPLCVFPYRSFASWLKVFLSRPEIETVLEKSWTSSPGDWKDIMAAPAIREFRGPDGRTLFSVERHGSLHLVFSLFIDWFNPYGNKKAGKSHSIGAIYMACLGLPIDIRYSPENIYLAGIIPGPKEPNFDQLNHLLTPLVDELLKIWTSGLYLTRTALRMVGRFVRVAMIPLVCDLPALRKAGGFAGHQAKNFCSFCPMLKRNINNLDRETWPTSRTWAQHLQLATSYRDGDQVERNQIFEDHGLRWSELLRLPYWDPTRFAVVDAMHNLFLGELRHHCMEVWGIDIKDKPPSGKKILPHSPEEQRKFLTKAKNALLKRSDKSTVNGLDGLRKGYVVSIAKLNNVAPANPRSLTKGSYIQGLLKWVKTVEDDMSIRIPPVLDYDALNFHLVAEGPEDISKYRVLSYDILKLLRKDIRSTYLPSWLERPPANFGNPGHGKLKADQWRTVCTINMVITLVREWSLSSASDNDRALLANFLHLVSAVDLASRRTMSPSRAAAFDEHMYAYLCGLRELFDHELVPNHHMSLHLYECLLLFGPVHGWWAFPFERYNGIIQRMNTNHRAADMPITFIRYFYIGAHLRTQLASIDWPKDPEYAEILDDFRGIFGDVTRGTRIVDSLPMGRSLDASSFDYRSDQEENLPLEVYEAILALVIKSGERFASAYLSHPVSQSDRLILKPSGQQVGRVVRDKILFGTYDSSRRNSFVLFHDPDSSVDLPSPGRINRIFLHARKQAEKLVIEPFLEIKAYKSLAAEDVSKDPYRQWPDIHTRLYYDEFQDHHRIVRLRDVLNHFAAHVYTPEDMGGRNCIVVRDLNRL